MKPLKPEEKKLLIVCAAVVVVVIALAVFVPGLGMLSRIRQMSEQRKEVAELQEDLQQAREKQQSMEKLEEQIAEAEARIAMVERRLPNDKQAPELFKELNDLAEDADLEYLSMVAQPVKDKGTHIEIPLEIDVTAKYHDLGKYVNSIENSERFAKIDGLKIDYNFDAPFEYLQDITLTVSTFMFKEKPTKGNASEPEQEMES